MSLIQEPVLRYLQDRPGLIVTAMAIAEDLGLKRSQVLAAGNFLEKDGLIKKVKTGVFCFDGGTSKIGNPLFEHLATTKAGDLVLQDEAGDITVVRPIN